VSYQEPEETGGGILADDMGLGKTLTMLSAIVRAVDAAMTFANKTNEYVDLDRQRGPVLSRATLVVAPSSCEFQSFLRLKC
jgi:SWI/SNF-related matrix-associated actin-dependent regulator of chromatin subfamily A3